MKIDWKDWRKQKPKDEPGHYLVWSEKYGLRLIRDHPSWWNLPACRAGGTPGPRVRFWVKVADPGIGDDAVHCGAQAATGDYRPLESEQD